MYTTDINDFLFALQELSFGADSNGSGAVALLELARVFSHLYNSGSGHGASGGKVLGRPYSSMLFLLSAGLINIFIQFQYLSLLFYQKKLKANLEFFSWTFQLPRHSKIS